MHHAIFVLDLAKKDDLGRFVEEITTLIKRQIPIRFGIVILPEKGDVVGEQLARIVYHLIDSYGRAIAMKFAEELLEEFDLAALPSKAKTLFTLITDNSTPITDKEKISYDELMEDASDVIANTRAWASRLGIDPNEGAIIGNGNLFVKDDTWVNKIGNQLQEDVMHLQKAVYQGDISDEDDILEFLFRSVPKRRNEYIFPTDTADLKMINLVGSLPEMGVVYVHGQTGSSPGVENATVIWIVDDFDSLSGVELVKSAAAFQAAHPHVTLGLVHNPGPSTGPPNLSLLLYHLAEQGLFKDPAAIERFLELIQEVDFNSHEKSDEAARLLEIKAESWRTVDNEAARKFWEAAKNFIKVSEMEAGQKGVIINGRVLFLLIVSLW